MQWALLKIIAVYQKYLSSIKRYRCAYGVLHGNGTCSSRIKKIVKTSKGFEVFPRIAHQFSCCQKAYIELSTDKKKDHKRKGDNKKDGDAWCIVADCGVSACLGFLS